MLGMFIRRAKPGRTAFLAPGTQAPAGLEIKECLRCTDTAYPGRTVAAGPPDHRRTQQVGRHQAVYVRAKMLSNFDGKRPLWPESKKVHGQNLGRRKGPKGQRDTSP